MPFLSRSDTREAVIMQTNGILKKGMMVLYGESSGAAIGDS
jgi:hypothetical protein